MNNKKKTERLIETVWEATEGLQAFEEVTYEIEISQNKGKSDTPSENRKITSRTWGFRNEKGEVVIPPIYTYVWKFEDGISKVCQNGKWGIIDKNGRVIIPIIYETLHITSDGMLQVEINRKWGCLKKNGMTIVEPRYDYIFPFRNGFAGIKKGQKYGFVNLENREVIAPYFDEIGQITSHGTVKVRNGNQWKEIILDNSEK